MIHSRTASPLHPLEVCAWIGAGASGNGADLARGCLRASVRARARRPRRRGPHNLTNAASFLRESNPATPRAGGKGLARGRRRGGRRGKNARLRPAAPGSAACVQADESLDDEHRAERDDDPVPNAEALVYAFGDGEGDDQGEGGDERPISKARIGLGHVVVPLGGSRSEALISRQNGGGAPPSSMLSRARSERPLPRRSGEVVVSGARNERRRLGVLPPKAPHTEAQGNEERAMN